MVGVSNVSTALITDRTITIGPESGFQYISILATSAGATIQGTKSFNSGTTAIPSVAIPLQANIPVNLGGVNIIGTIEIVVPNGVNVYLIAI